MNDHRTISLDRQFSDDERQFLVAVDRWKYRRRGRIPDWQDVLGIAFSLGYRHLGADMRDGQPQAFRRSLETFKRTKPFPSWCDVLGVLVALGYGKAPPPETAA